VRRGASSPCWRILAVAFLGTTGAALFAASAAARLLVVADPVPPRADAIVMLSGAPAERVPEAARLWRDGVAPLVVLTREQLPRGAAALRAQGIRLPEGHELAQDALLRLGVPPQAILVLRRRAQSTRSEANVIGRWACRRGMQSLVVVTSPSHTRRARLLLRGAIGSDIALAVRPARRARFPTKAWWRDRRAAKEVLNEWQKLANYWLHERWTLRPCGGLRRRHLAATAAWTRGASSPRACISRTMSQPPINFPPTNT